MKIVQFGTTDLRVSNLCLGTMQFGWTAKEPASFEVMDAFVEAGGNFIDTADIYSRWASGNPGGVSEEIIGRWMKSRGNRDSLVIATKARGQMWDGPDGEGLSRSHLERAVEDSLRRLQVDTIDLYQAHWPDEKTLLEETLTVVGELIAAGKIRYFGVSNFTTAQLTEAINLAENGLPRIVSLQPHYNLVWREEYESNKAALCDANGLAVIPYSPLEGGFLSGKYRRDKPPPKSARAGGARKFMNDKGWAVIDALDTVAQAHTTSVSAAAIAWLLTRPAVVSPIIGANSVEQLKDLLPAGELALSEAEVVSLDEASRPFLDKPAR